ncbi:hypothetical protein Zmor_025756 [Zophobas morio]|uniref:Tantalus-like domain-containing protein n=1 Tax=Zophobas morio TaxID=2755281 RepID=A0AA38HU17_9CUCU|nr:hypothetical protein Zmor_025756 [Zophobas morio]
MNEANTFTRKRRLSGRFIPPDICLESSSSDSSIIEEDSPKEFDPNNTSTIVEPISLQSALDMEGVMEETDEFNDSVIDEPATVRRSSRRRIATINSEVPTNTVNRVVKLTAKSSEKAIKNYYLDKKVKRTNPSLETIFEEPQVVNNEEVVMSSRKFKRVINFSAVPLVKNSAKIKKRKVKAKSLKNKVKHKKVTLKGLMDKLSEIDE